MPNNFVNITVDGYLEFFDEKKIKDLINENKSLRDQVDRLVKLGDKLSNCVHNSAAAGGFHDAVTGMGEREVASILLKQVREWDILVSEIKKKEIEPIKSITDSRR